MRIVLMGQEEPVYFGPFFRRLMRAKAPDIVAVVIAGRRGAGKHPKTVKERIKYLWSLWLLFEPKAFLKGLMLKISQKFLSAFRLVGSRLDSRSIEGLAKELGIPILHTQDINSEAFVEELKKYRPDVIINQSECLLKKAILSVPTLGTLNRHSSILPNFRGRVGSFWAHWQNQPQYGTTIHFVDENIDSGPIVVQKEYSLDPRSSYADILEQLFADAPALMLEALSRLENPNFIPLPNRYEGTKAYKFPSMEQIKEYRRVLKARRSN